MNAKKIVENICMIIVIPVLFVIFILTSPKKLFKLYKESTGL